MSRVRLIAAGWGTLFTGILAALIVFGSRNLAHFDAALVGYTFATLFSVFGITYRYSMWLQRPPTMMYWRRGWQLFLHPRNFRRNLLQFGRRLSLGFLLNCFIWRRSKERWLAHWLIMWGCIIAAAITFPLVFGWVHFQSDRNDLDRYVTYVFGFATFSFPIHSALGFFIFHGLVWASILVIAGVMLAMRRRVRDHGAAALQQFGEDFLPLILLFAVSVTGLMLTASYSWMKGHGYEFLALLHAVTVIMTLLYLPFGKFFHLFMRPAQLGVSFYKDVGKSSAQALCRRCQTPFAARMHIEDLIQVERELGYRYELPGGDHYQWICPKCRRAMFALAQGEGWDELQNQHLQPGTSNG